MNTNFTFLQKDDRIYMKKHNKPKIIGKVGGKVIEDTNALTLLNDAEAYFKSFSILQKNSKKIKLLIVKYFLLCRSIELYMKSFIKFSTGGTINIMKTHKLLSLYDMCKSHMSLNSSQIEILENLDKYYPNPEKRFEYTKISNEGMTLPTINDVETLTQELRTKIIEFKNDENMQRYL